MVSVVICDGDVLRSRSVHYRRRKSLLTAIVVASAICTLTSTLRWQRTATSATNEPCTLNSQLAFAMKGPAAPSYQQLSETTLGAKLDLKTLREELTADTWADSTLPIGLLKADGATDIDVRPWTDGWTRTVSYKLPVLPGGIKARVENTYTVQVESDDSLSLEIVSVTFAPVVQNFPAHTLYSISGEGEDMSLRVSGFVNWTRSLPAAFTSPVERGIQKSQMKSGEGFLAALLNRITK